MKKITCSVILGLGLLAIPNAVDAETQLSFPQTLKIGSVQPLPEFLPPAAPASPSVVDSPAPAVVAPAPAPATRVQQRSQSRTPTTQRPVQQQQVVAPPAAPASPSVVDSPAPAVVAPAPAPAPAAPESPASQPLLVVNGKPLIEVRK